MSKTTRAKPTLALPKRYLTTAEVCHVYGTTPDFLEGISVADLPRNKRGHRTVLFDVIDCERFFASLRIAGNEGTGRARELPVALPVAIVVPTDHAA